MAEGMLGGILGGEDEKPEVEAPEALAGAEAFAAAVAAKLAGGDPEVARDTSAFLKEQTELLKVQKEHLKDEHALRLAHLRNQLREEKVRRFGLRLRVGFQLFIALIATVIGVGLAIMIRDAFTSRSVVINTFDIAPNIATQVPSGKIVAGGLLDVLRRIQASNETNPIRRSLSSAWTNDIAIEVPETGVSVGELERMLKARFGHDQHIDGDLVQTEKGGLALTVRGTEILPKTFSDDARNLEKLLVAAGEYVYGQSQPGLWASFLANSDRTEEAIQFCQSAYPTADPGDRPFLLNAWGNALINKGGEGAMREALPLFREALRLKADFWIAANNVMFALGGLGDEEGIVQVGEQMVKAAGGRHGRVPEIQYQNYDSVVWDVQAQRASMLADLDAHRGIGVGTAISGPIALNVAELDVYLHDLEAPAFALKVTAIDEKSLPDVAVATFVRALLASEKGDFTQAAREWDAFSVVYANPVVSSGNLQRICWAAPDYEKNGQPAKADSALGKLTFVDCYRFRGDVLDMRGDWTGARDWYAKAVKLGPSIPSGYYSWGLALAKHGDLDGAAAKFKDGNQKSPHWADPLKAWGDVLLKQSKTKEALEKYDEALKYAPNWKELKEAREAVAK